MLCRDAVENHWLNATRARTTRAIKIQGVSRVLGMPGPDGPSEPERRPLFLSLSGMVTPSWHRPAPMTGNAVDSPPEPLRRRVASAWTARATLMVHGADRPGRPGTPRALRARRLAVVAVALRRGAPTHAEPCRRGRSGAGDLPPGVPRLRRVPGGDQPQSVALPDLDQQLHQHLSEEAARATDGRGAGRCRRVVPVRPAGRAEGRGLGGG